MIRRLLIALAILTASVVVLHLTIGLENFLTPDSKDGGGPIEDAEPARTDRTGIGIGDAGAGGAGGVSASFSGRFEFAKAEPHDLPDGDQVFLPRYELVAKDSKTERDDLVRLMDVTVKIFQIEEGEPPIALHVGSIDADEAMVEIGRDAKGQPSIQQDRDMDLFGVRMTSTPASKVQGLFLDVARLKVRQTEEGIRFETPRDDQPFHVEFGGENASSLDGEGLRGFLPSEDTRHGAMTLDVNQRPRLLRGDVSLRAIGPLSYREDIASGAATIRTSQGVEIQGRGLGEGEAVATGEVLTARLVRYGEGDDRQDRRAVWRSLELEGDRAALISEDFELYCGSMSLFPSKDGQPARFTARNEPVVIDKNTLTRFESNDRIHLVDVATWFDSIHGKLGLTGVRMPRMAEQLVMFEGNSTIVDGRSRLVVTATQGLRVLRSSVDDSPVIAHGRGDVHVERLEQETDLVDLMIDSDDGFTLHQSGGGQWIRLGPAQPTADHNYSVEQRTADSQLRVFGSGYCELDRPADGSSRVVLRSTEDDIALERSNSQLTGIRELDADISAGGELRAFDAKGTRSYLTARIPSEPEPTLIDGLAKRIHSEDGRSFTLSGTDDEPAELRRGPRDSAVAPTIEIYRIGLDQVRVLARGGKDLARVRIEGDPDDPERPDQDVTMVARRILFAPRMLPTRVMWMHGMPAFGSTNREHLLARGDVQLSQLELDSDEVAVQASGDSLLLGLVDQGALLRGLPAEFQDLGDESQQLIARADEIRFRIAAGGSGEAQLRRSERFDPMLDLRREVGSSDSGPFGDMRMTCQGDIDAVDQGAWFGGPVRVQGLTPEGEVDPEGLDMSAGNLAVDWSQDQREIRSLKASGDPVLRMGDVTASGETMKVDVPARTLEVSAGARNLAAVELGEMRTTGRLVRLNYVSRQVEAWRLQVRPTATEQP